MKNSHSKKNQGGFTLIEMAVVVGIVAVIGAAGLYALPKIMFTNSLTSLQQEVAEFGTAAYRAKKRAPNYRLVNTQKVCAYKYVEEKYCGATPGVGVNSFGGDIKVDPNPTNPGLRNVTVTIPNDLERISEIADTLAGQSRNACQMADGCSTLTVAGNKITVTL